MSSKLHIRENFSKAFRFTENALVCILLLLLAVITYAEMSTRVIFKSGVPESTLIMGQLVLLIGFFAGMITSREKEHLAIALHDYIKNKALKLSSDLLNLFVSVFFLVIFAVASISYVNLSFLPNEVVAGIPRQIIAWIMPIGYAVMAYRSIKNAKLEKLIYYIVPFLAVALALFFSTTVWVKLFYGFETPELYQPIIDFCINFFSTWKFPLILLLIVCAFSGTPLFIVLGGIALILLQQSGSELEMVPNQAYTMLTSTNLPTIPLFTLTGFILSESKAAERLVRVFRSLFGWLPGGMIIVSVLVCAFFTTFTGASGVTILALGGLLSAILVKKGKYPESFTTGLLTAVGSIGLLFPPSLPIILVGASTQTSIIQMFAGGIVPGIILVLSMIVFGIFSAVKYKVPVDKFDGKEAFHSVLVGFWDLLLPVVIVVGYFSGFLTIIETASFSVLYTIVLALVKKDFRIRDLPKVILKAVPIIGGVLVILAVSQALQFYIVDARVPEMLTEWVTGRVTSPLVFLLLLNLILLVVGCLMDIYSAIMVVLPLIVPLGAAFGIHPVHLGIIFIINMELGFMTPPVGLNLFLASYRFKKPFLTICKDVLPFLGIQILIVLLITYVPILTTGILNFIH